MKKRGMTLEAARLGISRLVGKRVKLKLNGGRRRMRCCEGVLAEAHSNVFVVRTEGIPSEISCSYVDVLCGDAVVFPCADKSPPVTAK